MDSKKIKDIIFKCKNGITKAIRYRGSKYIFGAIIGVTILVLTLTVSSPTLINKSYAAGNGYQEDGYYTDTDTTYTANKAFTNGYFYVNIYKNSTRFVSALFKVTHKQTASDAATLYNYLMNNTAAYYFDYAGNGYGDYENWMKVGDSASQGYGTKKNGIVDTDNNGFYEYAAPTIKIKIPAGYKYDHRANGYDSTRFNKPTALAALYCSTSPYTGASATSFTNSNCYTQTTDNKYVKMLYADSPSINNSASMTFSSQASNRWTSAGRLQINVVKSTGLGTRQGQKSGYTSTYYRARQSYTVVFEANKTTITYNANGGSGAPSSQTKTYDSALTLSTTKPTRSGYTFTKWCTQSNGGGTCYNSGQSLGAQIWPVATSVTLYAQWRLSQPTANEWCGSTVDSIGYQSTALGWQNGYGYVHLGKCDIDEDDVNECVPYSTNRFKSSYTYTGASTQTAAYLTYINGHAVQSNFVIDIGNTDNFQFVGTSTTSSTSSFNGNSASTYIYFNGPTVKMRPPKGYKYWTNIVGYPNVWSAYLEFSFRTTSGSGAHTHAFAANPGPYANDSTWVQGSLTLNNAAIGHRTYSNYRAYEALCIAFKPNSRNIIYNANSGTGTMSNGRYVYNEENEAGAVIADNGFTRSGYEFVGWNTAAGGTGTWYEEREEIPGNEWPSTTSDLTLYAQWAKVHTAKIYYNASQSGSTNVQSVNVSCSEGQTINYFAYPFGNTSTGQDYIYIYDEFGSPVSNFYIEVWDRSLRDVIGDGTTDSSGKLRVDNMPNYDNLGRTMILVPYPYGDGELIQFSDENTGSTFSPTGYYESFSGKEAGNKCTATLPEEVTDSIGSSYSSFAGLASSTGTMTKSANSIESAVKLTSSSQETYYSIYSTPVTVYYYNP